MAKYSTGSSNNNSNLNGSVCELCGSEESLSQINISGTTVIVCKDCKKNHQKTKKDNKKDTTREKTWHKYTTTTEPDNDWVTESRPDYGNAKTPYLVRQYSDKFKKSLSESDIDISKLSNEIDVSTESLKAILQNEAIKNDVTVEDIELIENYFDITLQD